MSLCRRGQNSRCFLVGLNHQDSSRHCYSAQIQYHYPDWKYGVVFWVVDVCPDPLYGAGPGQFPAQVRAADHREATNEVGGGGGWDYPPLSSATEEAGFEEIWVHIQKR